MKSAPKWIAILLYIGGALLLVGGAATWIRVSDELAQERITVTDDASCQAGQQVNGPLEAFCMAEIIKHHALEATNGKTYSELDREDPLRATAMNASFLRASLFTSVVSFGIAAFAAGVGVLMILIGMAIAALDRRTRAVAAPARETAAA
jgi:hypothetical protein